MNVETLRRVDYFSQLNRDEFHKIEGQAFEVSHGRDEVVFEEGEHCTGLYVVISGSVKVSRISSEGREQVLDVLRPGETFGDVPTFDGEPTHHTATTLEEPTLVTLIPKDVMRSLVRENGTVAESVIRVFAQRIRIQATLAADLTHFDVTGRVARILVVYQGVLRAELHTAASARPGVDGGDHARGRLARSPILGASPLHHTTGGDCGNRVRGATNESGGRIDAVVERFGRRDAPPKEQMDPQVARWPITAPVACLWVLP